MSSRTSLTPQYSFNSFWDSSRNSAGFGGGMNFGTFNSFWDSSLSVMPRNNSSMSSFNSFWDSSRVLIPRLTSRLKDFQFLLGFFTLSSFLGGSREYRLSIPFGILRLHLDSAWAVYTRLSIPFGILLIAPTGGGKTTVITFNSFWDSSSRCPTPQAEA